MSVLISLPVPVFANSSATAQSVTVADPDVATSLTVQVPPTTTSGAELNLVANLTPTNAQVRWQFKVDGDPVGSSVPVSAGAAILPQFVRCCWFVRGDCGVHGCCRVHGFDGAGAERGGQRSGCDHVAVGHGSRVGDDG